MYYRIFAKFYEGAARKMCLECQDFIQKGAKLLDLGCGSGIVGETFKNFFQADLIGVDVKDINISSIPFKIYDGFYLPFPENSFDVVLINYVLHHSDNPVILLKEAKRVTKDKIIIHEDLPEGFLSNLICKIHGISFNKFFKIQAAASFKSEKEWERIFSDAGLKLIFKKRVNTFPVKKELFVLGRVAQW